MDVNQEALKLEDYLSNRVVTDDNTVDLDAIRYAEGYLPLSKEFTEYNRSFSRLVSLVSTLQSDTTNIDYPSTKKEFKQDLISIVNEFYTLVIEFNQTEGLDSSKITTLEEKISSLEESLDITFTVVKKPSENSWWGSVVKSMFSQLKSDK